MNSKANKASLAMSQQTDHTDENFVHTHRSDLLGQILAVSCMIHCFFFPILVVMIPVLEIWHDSFWVHFAFIIFAAGIGSVTFLGAESRLRHRSSFWTGLVGLSLLLLGLLFAHASFWETAFSVLGGVFLIAAHRLRAKKCCHHDHDCHDHHS